MPRTIDDDFADIAAQAPGFGGLHFDEVGDLVVNTTDLGSRAALEDAILAAGYLRPPAGTSRPPVVKLRQAEYDWHSLKDWRDALDRAWPRGMNLLDIDEVTNRVAIGLETEAAWTAVERVLLAKGIPPEAVVVRSVGRITLGIAPVVNHGCFLHLPCVRDSIRPVPGGVQLDPGGPIGLCTLGVNAFDAEAEYGFITASHCTNRFGDGPDGTTMWQNLEEGFKFLGEEYADPDVMPPGQGVCVVEEDDPPFIGCRLSDATFVRYSGGGLQSDHGTIARTQGPGSLLIDGNKPRFFLNEPPFRNLAEGELVRKIGRTTGWTEGSVSATCVNAVGAGSGIKKLCSDVATLNADFGDSGSPVFTWDGAGDFVDLRGILWGRLESDTFFSRWYNVLFEMESAGLELQVSF